MGATGGGDGESVNEAVGPIGPGRCTIPAATTQRTHRQHRHSEDHGEGQGVADSGSDHTTDLFTGTAPSPLARAPPKPGTLRSESPTGGGGAGVELRRNVTVANDT